MTYNDDRYRNISIVKEWLHLDSKEAGPKIAAIFSIVETSRRLNIRFRPYLLGVLPSLADGSIQSLAELAPAAYAARMVSDVAYPPVT